MRCWSSGIPAAAVRLLAAVAPEHPYREQLWALLARAQYACTRQADALTTLATLRSRLAEDLGVDPSPVVRDMERAILTQDPSLDRRDRIVPSARTLPAASGRSDHSGLSTSSVCRHRRRRSTVRPATSATATTAPSSHNPFSEAIQAWSTAIPIVT